MKPDEMKRIDMFDRVKKDFYRAIPESDALAAIETARRDGVEWGLYKGAADEQERILAGVQRLPSHDMNTQWDGVALHSETGVMLLDVCRLIVPIQPAEPTTPTGDENG